MTLRSVHAPGHLTCLVLATLACGGGSSGARLPGPPAALVADTGDGAFSVGWDPPADSGGAPIVDYLVTVSPDLAGSGPTDRNWNSPLIPGTNGSAALLAQVLTAQNFITLRYDKRASGPHVRENMSRLMGKISMQGHREELAGGVLEPGTGGELPVEAQVRGDLAHLVVLVGEDERGGDSGGGLAGSAADYRRAFCGD